MKEPVVTIIGAGPGGLAAALLLARQGKRVRVLERLPRVGGRCSAIEEDGFRFDVGPTFFLYPRVLEDVFRQVGRNLWDEVPMTKLDPQYRINFGVGGHLDAKPDVDQMVEEIRRFAPADADSFRGFMDHNRKKLAKFRPILEAPFSSVLDLVNSDVVKAAPWLKPWNSVAGELQKAFTDPRMVIALSFQSKYLGMSPFRCPSFFTILAFLEYEYGVFHPTGGCSAVSDRMAQIAQDMGVEFHLEEPVRQIRFNGRRATAVVTDRAEYATDALVVNADFSRAMERLVPNHLRRRWTNEKIAKKKFSCSTFMMYLGIDGQYDLPHHLIHIANDYLRNIREIEEDHILPDDPSFYLQNACVTDSTLAPEGMSTLYLLVPVSHQHPKIDWTVERDRFRARVIRQLEKVGINDLEQRIRFEKVVTPDDWDTSYEVYNGATFNLAHNLGQMLLNRPRNRFEDLEGVYLVGGGTHPGSGLPVIYESARITSRLIAEEFKTNSVPVAAGSV